MDLVTVTCHDDRHQMLLQAASIEKYLEPCRHWVIINDEKIDAKFWTDLLTPFYKKHELKLLFPFWKMFPKGGGYQKQQCYKLWIYRHIKDDYLILDSKNFFIRPASTKDWSNIIGPGVLENFSNPTNIWLPTFDAYQKHLNVIGDPARQLAIHTPFVIKKELIDSIENLSKFLIWFNSQEVLHSEFLYYSLIAENKGLLKPEMFLTKMLHLTFFPNRSIDIKPQLDKVDLTPQIKAIGLHREYIKKLDQKNLEILNVWLSNKGFDNCQFNV